jgi:hypothetical protein
MRFPGGAFSYIFILLLVAACYSSELAGAGDGQTESEARPVVEETQSETAGCQVDPRQRQDIAIWPEAEIETTTANFITYQTGGDIDQVVKFYQTEMPRSGWGANEGNVVEPDQANLIYTKADEVALLMIYQAEGGTRVVITINNARARPGCGKAGS